MVRDIVRLVRWEQFKLRRRWMPWILLTILVLFSQIGIWVTFASYNDLQAGPQGMSPVPPSEDQSGNIRFHPGPGQLREGPEMRQQLREQYDSFTLPGSIPNAMSVAQGIGLILLAILAASAIGSEYGLGTLRLVLALGVGRHRYLASKFTTLAFMAAAGLIIVVAVTAVSSLIAGGLAQAPEDTIASSTWSEAGTALGRTWASLIPALALTGLITVMARSTAVGMAVGLGYGFAEQIVVAILAPRFEWFRTASEYFLSRNISALAGSRFGPGGSADLDTLHAALVLAVYTLALGGMAFWLFRRRDISGASGG